MSERDVAIIGMACIFPGAPDLATYWRNLQEGGDAITDLPAWRCDPVFYDASSSAPDRFYARRGGFIDEYARFDPAAHGLMPVAARGAEPDQLLALEVAMQAIADSGYADRPFARAKTSVILGRGNYPGPGIVRLINLTHGAEQLVAALSRLLPDLAPGQLAEIKRDFQSHCGSFGPDSAIGLVPNLVASRIANRLDLGGSAYTVDAACASTLVAVDHACRELASGAAQLVIAGGVHICHDPAFWSVFSQLGALSRSERMRPFDRRADGLLIGEGIGVLVLKRLADARRADDRIYAVIRGTGVASDGRDVSLMTPSIAGQTTALTRAWQAAGLAPDTVGLVEAHGTGTAVGDAAELDTLARIFGRAESDALRVPLGSVKSMIGHAMPAAGAAGLIKAALAVYHAVQPPTLHCEEPNPAIQRTRFRIASRAQPWEGTKTRRAAVNAFGFGGINAHVILDAPATAGRTARRARPMRAAQALLLAGESREALLDGLNEQRRGGQGPWRLALFDPTPERVAQARSAVEAGRARRGRDGLYFAPGGLIQQGGGIAFMFPGVEASFAPSVSDIGEQLGLEVPDLRSVDLEHQGSSVLALNAFMLGVASRLGLEPDVLVGHSVGEWSAMFAAQMFESGSLDEFIAALRPGMLRIAEVAYAAVGAGAARVAQFIEDLPGLTVSHDNCVHQSIVCGPDSQIERLAARLREARILFEVLPFRSGFHSSALKPHLDHYRGLLERVHIARPRLPVWSATTCAPFPEAARDIADLFCDHLVRPVRFRELVLALYAQGARVFVQVGIGSTAAFVDDVLVGKPHLAVSLIASRRPGLEQLRRAVAALFVEGAGPDLEALGFEQRSKPAHVQRPMSLELSVPLVRLSSPPLSMQRAAPVEVSSNDPLLQAFAQTQRAIENARRDVALALADRTKASPVPAAPRTEKLTLSVADYPELADHCLIPQPPGWPTIADRAPAVPMTMSIALMRELAERYDGAGRIAVALENVVANTWLNVTPPAQLNVEFTRIDAGRVRVKLDRYVEGTVTLATRYPHAPEPAQQTLLDPVEFPIAVDRIYADGWLFHGPRYQGIVGIESCGSNGMRGMLRALPAKGALLDAAGQLVGLCVMQSTQTDRLAMPVKVGRIEFHAPDPIAGSLVPCNVTMRHLGAREVRADLELIDQGRVYARIRGWEDWRFPTAGGIFEVMRKPDRNLLALADPAGFMVLADAAGWNSATFEFLVRRFLSAAEIDARGGMRAVQRQGDWVRGRIAAKDAVRRLLFARGHAPLFPIEVRIGNDASGKPLVQGPFDVDVRVSIAHKAGIAVALAAEGFDPGIDLEAIEPRDAAFVAVAFAEDELRQLPNGDRDEWLARFWAGREAAGKSQGTGLSGDPLRLRITRVEGETLMIDQRWIQTRKLRDLIVAWTLP